MSFLYGIIPFIIMISIIVTFHELGHYGVARLFNTRIEKFSVGFGKHLWQKIDKRGVVWAISAIPLGGYVKFAGDENIASLMPDAEELARAKASIIEREGEGAVKDYYHFKPLWQRFLIILAGPVANFILAIFVFASLAYFLPQPKATATISAVEAGSVADMAGLKVGDLIVSMDGAKIDDPMDVVQVVAMHADTSIEIEVLRAGTAFKTRLTPQRVKLGENNPDSRVTKGYIGISLGGKATWVRPNPVDALKEGVVMTGDVLKGNLTYIGRIFKGREDGGQISGILGMTKVAGDAVDQVSQEEATPLQKTLSLVYYYAQFMAVISVGVGFVNLLPIPPLDGGHLLLYTYQAITRRTLPPVVQGLVFRVAITFVLGLMLFGLWNDLHNTGLVSKFKGLFS